jgi:hypothetical protein
LTHGRFRLKNTPISGKRGEFFEVASTKPLQRKEEIKEQSQSPDAGDRLLKTGSKARGIF